MEKSCILGRAVSAPARYRKSRNTKRGGYDKGVLGKKSKAPKSKLRKARK